MRRIQHAMNVPFYIAGAIFLKIYLTNNLQKKEVVPETASSGE